MKKILPIILVVILLIFGYFFFTKSKQSPFQKNESQMQEEKMMGEFTDPKKSAHYETNTPAHASVHAAVPINIVIDFNFDLAKPSSIKIEKDSKDYGVGETIIDPNKLSMRRDLDPASPDGIYAVSYNACWPDGSCHDGSFQFAIDKSSASSYEDLTGQDEVTISLLQIKFMPMNIRVNKGTKLTWVNDDDVEHYVNTDSHPAHTYYKEQNSKSLKKGDSYSITFNKAGVYPYHCSAHAESMIGSIVVE